MDIRSEGMADQRQEISIIGIVDNARPSAEVLLSLPIIAYPKYAMFGAFKTLTKSIEFSEDLVRITKVSPNDSTTRFKYHINIPFVEIQRLLYCKGNTDSMVLIKPTLVSCRKIQDCMFLGDWNSPNGLKLDINSGDPREHYIIVLLSAAMDQRFVQTMVYYTQRRNSRLVCQEIDARMARIMLTRTQSPSVVRDRAQARWVALGRAMATRQRYLSTLFRLARSAPRFSSTGRSLSHMSDSSPSLIRSRVPNSHLPTEPIPSPSAPLATTPDVTNPSMIESIEPLSVNSNDSPSDGSLTTASILSRRSTITIDDDEEVMEETAEEIVETTDETVQEQFDKVTITYPKGSKIKVNLELN